VIGDLPALYPHVHEFIHQKLRSWMGVPLICQDKLIGMIALDCTRPNFFTESHVRLASAFADQVAVLLNNTWLYEERGHRLAELEAVNKISTSLRTAQTLEEMLPLLVEEILAALDTRAGAIFLYDSSRNDFYKAVSRGFFTRLPERFGQSAEEMARILLATGEAYFSRDFSKDPVMQIFGEPDVPAGWGGSITPIKSIDEIVGVMFIAVQHPRQISSVESHLLSTMAEIAGNAVHRMRLYEQTERRLKYLGALHVIDMTISASVDLRITLDILLEQVTDQLHVDAADIMLYNAQLQMLEYKASRGFRSKPPAEGVRLRLGEGHAGQAALEHRIKTVTKLTKSGQTAPLTWLWAGEHFVTYYAVPLIAKGQIKGVLNIYHRSLLNPDPEWKSFLETLSTQAAIAIDNAFLFDNLQRVNLDLTRAWDATIEGWSRALDLRDKETGDHSRKLADLTLRLASLMGVKDNEQVHMRRGALLHDIGKMAIPDSILLKPGPLTDSEWDLMKEHPKYAFDLLSPISYLHPALDIPYCHHEKWDGSGYPRKLQGEQIPLSARIFAVADVWDALISDRTYRKAWSKEKSREYISDQAGKHFDPKVVDIFIRLISE
jgi:HD-GYP domain-containing protein (c-di-GMP phosphodiesterase class II)